jgi:putative copper export protein
MLYVLELVHLIAAAVWLGGLVTLGASVAALRRAGVDREALRAVARMVARVSWAAMGVAVITGLLRVHFLYISWSYSRLHIKIGLVTVAIALALFHQLTARRSSAAARGIVQLVILLVSLAIFAAAVAL